MGNLLPMRFCRAVRAAWVTKLPILLAASFGTCRRLFFLGRSRVRDWLFNLDRRRLLCRLRCWLFCLGRCRRCCLTGLGRSVVCAPMGRLGHGPQAVAGLAACQIHRRQARPALAIRLVTEMFPEDTVLAGSSPAAKVFQFAHHDRNSFQ